MFSNPTPIKVYDSLDSTSSEARRVIEAGQARLEWIVALEQTAGYGRRGAAWRQGTGDVAASLMFPIEGDIAAAGQLSFVAALAAADAIDACAPSVDVALKWPNDILLDGAKAAGLLLEMIPAPKAAAGTSNLGASNPGTSNAEMWAVWGIGVNVVSKPEGLPYQAARLLDVIDGAPPSPKTIVEMLDRAFRAHYEIWRGQGFAPIRAAWTQRAAGLGKPVTARLPDRTVSGTFKGIDETGALVMATENGEEHIAAGAVFFGA